MYFCGSGIPVPERTTLAGSFAAPERGTSGNLPDLDNDRNADTTPAPSGPACWTILETGFGLGLNFLSAWACWQASPTRPTTLRFVSTEAHPVSAQDIRRAGADDPRLHPLAERLADAWPDTATLAAWYLNAVTEWATIRSIIFRESVRERLVTWTM